MWKKVIPYNESGIQGYSVIKTEGTKWAIEHVRRTFKRVNENGELVMLTPPPGPGPRRSV
jgi:hypothetical protein